MAKEILKQAENKPTRRQSIRRGLGQLTLVEHSLCPVDGAMSLVPNLVHETSYFYSDKNRRRRKASVRVNCPAGLTVADEFLLLGLLAIVMRDKSADGELYATPHYCLRQLGLIDQHTRRGGRQYQQFSSGIERLSLVNYQNDYFYDPQRAEHRKVGCGFLSYSLPIDPNSSRAWRIVFDPIFFELVQATSGHLWFDLETYRSLDPASRRLFLLLSKTFGRRKPVGSLRLELRHLAINVIGYAPSVATCDLKVKLRRVLTRLAAIEVINTGNWFEKHSSGNYRIVVTRGKYFERPARRRSGAKPTDAPLFEPLSAIGFDGRMIQWLMRSFSTVILREWTDITLAAKERFGPTFFKKSPQAFLVDNLKAAASGLRTPPDWWHEVRKEEERRAAERHRNSAGRKKEPTAASDVLDDVFSGLIDRGKRSNT